MEMKLAIYLKKMFSPPIGYREHFLQSIHRVYLKRFSKKWALELFFFFFVLNTFMVAFLETFFFTIYC